jgi:magnesium-transporting ATPase (P-type)
MFANFTISLSILGFIYSATNNMIFSLLTSILPIFAISIKVDEKSEELKNKVNEIKNLAEYI